MADEEKAPAAAKKPARPEDQTPSGLALAEHGEPKKGASAEEIVAHQAKLQETYLKARRG